MTTSSSAASRSGIVAVVVLRAARLSSGLSEARLATIAGTDSLTISAWENGSSYLAFEPHPQLKRLETGLLTAGASPQLVNDIAVAAWCDLDIRALTGAGDVSYLQADPLAANDAFRELLAWSLTGRMPGWYRRYAPAGPLLDPQVAALIANAVHVLARACGAGPSDPVT